MYSLYVGDNELRPLINFSRKVGGKKTGGWKADSERLAVPSILRRPQHASDLLSLCWSRCLSEQERQSIPPPSLSYLGMLPPLQLNHVTKRWHTWRAVETRKEAARCQLYCLRSPVSLHATSNCIDNRRLDCNNTGLICMSTFLLIQLLFVWCIR